MQKLSIFKFKPELERENEMLWSSKEGYAGYLKRISGNLNAK